MSASAGKVVLLSSTTAIAGGTICPSGPDVVDIVGYGPATNCAENAATASNLSATTAALRVNSGATDTDNNSLDFAVAVPNPRNSTTTSAMVSIVATDPSASEFGANPGSFTVSRIGGNTGLALNVNIAITGSAANGLDFTPTLTSPIAIPANQASTLMTLTPVNDAAPEGTEVVVLTLTAGAGYAVSVATATVTIADDDAVDTAPSVISTTPAEGASSVLLNTALQVNFSEQVDVIGGAITVECPNGSVVASNVTAANNVNSVVLTPVPVWPANTNCSVKVASSGVTDVDNTDPPNNPAANVPATSDR